MKDGSRRIPVKALWLMALLFFIAAPDHALAQNIVKLGKDAAVAGGNQVDSVLAIGGDVRVDGFVREDAVALGGSVFLGPGAVVRGNVVSLGGMVSMQQGARVFGETTEVDISRAVSFHAPFTHGWWTSPYEFPTVPRFLPMLGFLVLALVTVALAPGMVGFISATIEKGPVSSFFWGILGSASVFPIAFILLISIIGVVLIPFEFLAAGICFFLGYTSVATLIGKRLLAAARFHEKPVILETFLGMVILWLVSQAPFIGWIFISMATVVGFGGVMASIFRRLAWGEPQPPLPQA